MPWCSVFITIVFLRFNDFDTHIVQSLYDMYYYYTAENIDRKHNNEADEYRFII